MHYKQFKGLVKILGFQLIVLVTSCNETNNSYPQISKIIALKENNKHTLLLKELQDGQFTESIQQLTIDLPYVNFDSIVNLKPYLKSIRQYFLFKSNFENSKANDLYKKQLNHSLSKESYPYLHFYVNCVNTKKLTPELIQFVDKCNPKELDAIEFYHFIKGLFTLGSKSLIGVGIELRLAILHYTLFLIDDKDMPYLSLKGKIFFKKAFQLSQETEDYQSSIEDSYRKARNIFSKLANENYSKLVAWHENRLNESTLNQNEINEISVVDIPKLEKIRLLTDIGIAAMDSFPEESKNCFIQALELIGDNKCSLHNAIINNYLGLLYLSNKEQINSRKYFLIANEINNCQVQDSILLRYINLRFQPIEFRTSKKNRLKEENFNQMQLERTIAEKILKENSQHLDDYLSEFGIRVMKNFINQSISNKQIIRKIIKTVYDSKERNLITANRTGKLNQVKNQNLTRVELLKQLNDFKLSTNLQDSRYKEILGVLFSEFLSRELNSTRLKELDFNSLTKYLSKHNFQLLSFYSFRDEYHGFLYDGQNLQLFELNSEKLIELFQIYKFQVENRSALNQTINEIKGLLNDKIGINSSKKLIVSGDGLFNQIPLHLIFNNKNDVIRIADINNLASHEKLLLKKENNFLYSYSDSSTIANRSVREYLELPYALLESKKILRITNIPRENFIKGWSCSNENFLANSNADLIHFASHASLDLQNRLDNYLVLRSPSKNSSKLYAYEIESHSKLGEVVILSACQTEIGLQRSGSGTFSLSNAFLRNGAQSVLKTLWKVNDKSSSDFMIKLYSNWSKGISLDKALSQTRKFFQNSNNSIYDWAGFVLEGNGEAFIE